MDFNMEQLSFTLDNDFVVLFEQGLDGGGYDHLPDFRNAVSTSGKETYNNAVEWCAGFGVIGFDFINSNTCENMSFVDCYEPAINWLNITAKHNNVEDKITTYLADKIALIPDDVKWDLVLANPPHSFEPETKQYFKDTIGNLQSQSDVIRITCDEDLLIHKEFFANIRNHLLPDADVFISEVGHLDTVQTLAENAGLVFVTKHAAPMLSRDSKTDAVIFHFKEPL